MQDKFPAKGTWADKVEITENSEKVGLELRFNAAPSPELQTRLRAIAFRPSRSELMWYGAHTPEHQRYTDELQAVISTNPLGPELYLKPSAQPLKTSIEKKEFSFVLITLRDGENRNFIVFEPSKPRAEVIATAFARKEFGDNFLTMAVQPRTHIREARVLFEEGKIISETIPVQLSKPKENMELKTEESASGTSKIPIADFRFTTMRENGLPAYTKGQMYFTWNEADNYVRSIIGYHSDVHFKLEWVDGSTHEGSIDLEPAEFFDGKENLLTGHVNAYYRHLATSEPNIIYSQKVIDDAKEKLFGYQLRDNDVPKAKAPAKKQEKSEPFRILESFHKWLKEQGTNQYQDIENATREEFNLWATETGLPVEQQDDAWAHHVAFMKAVKKMHEKIHSAPAIEPYTSIYKKILKIIPGLIEHLEDGVESGKSVVDPEGGLMDLHMDNLGKDKEGNYLISLAHNYRQEGDVMRDPDMEIRLIPGMQAAEALTFHQDNPPVHQRVYVEKDGKHLVNQKLKKQLNSFLNHWLRNILNQGHRIDLAKAPEESEHAVVVEPVPEKEGSGPPSKIVDLKIGNSIFLANVLVPSGTSEPFWSANFDLFDIKTLLPLKFPHLLNITTNGLKEATPLTLFELIQLHTPFEFGANVGWKELVEEWNDRGKELFEQLGYPTDLLYPYVSLIFRYKAIKPLKAILNSDNSSVLNWSSVIEHYRPLGYLDKAKDLINVVVHSKDREIELISSQNSRPEKDRQDAINSLEDDIENLQTGIEVIETYLDSKDDNDKVGTPINEPTHLKVRAQDLVGKEKFVPNVLVPVGLREPFLTEKFGHNKIASVIKSDYPSLLRLNEDNLATATALEMLQIVKMSHPTNYGINVERSDMLREWERRGKELFKDLGYPIQKNYPYVNVHVSYESVDALETILFDLNRDGNQWWTVADYWFPVADMHEALNYVAKLTKELVEQQNSFANSKTGKPKGDKREEYRSIQYKLNSLAESKQVIEDYMKSMENPTGKDDEPDEDPLANINGVFTEATSRANFERINIPVPAVVKFDLEITIAKTSKGDYRNGINANKKFGDNNSESYSPSIDGEIFATRQEALKDAALTLDQRLRMLLKGKDHTLHNEEKKNKNITIVLKALHEFALANDIELPGISTKEEKKTKVPTHLVKGLEDAYWKEEDEQYPVNKALILDMEFDQARLREAIREKIESLSLDVSKRLARELSLKFEERRPLEKYGEGFVTIGKKGDKREKVLVAVYVDDIILDNDIHKKGDFHVMTYLVKSLFDTTEILADLPQNKTKKSAQKVKKQSQLELNQEIERLIDQKDEAQSAFTVEDKNHFRLYTGSGGLLKQGASGRGVLYEYYTQDVVVQKMWGLAFKFGYNDGPVLEPSVGTGNFLKYVPKNVQATAYETNHYAARISQICYPFATVHEKEFESIFFTGNIHLKDNFKHTQYSLVIGNPPYGEFSGKYAGMGEKKWTGVLSYDQYFILRGLDLLAPGGLLVYVIPSSFLENKEKLNAIKEKIFARAELLDAYRLPERTFETTDIGTDIIVLKKRPGKEQE